MTLDLFQHDDHKSRDIPLKDGELTLWNDFIAPERADNIFKRLLSTLNWQQPEILIYGRRLPIPRLQAWHGEDGQSYTYSSTKFDSAPWNEELSYLKQLTQETTGKRFNSVLCNLYRNGLDSVGWHADNEQELGNEPVVASISLGAARTFQMRQSKNKSKVLKLELPHNSLLLMGRGVQRNWEHQVPKESKVTEPRLNLTFRWVFPGTNT